MGVSPAQILILKPQGCPPLKRWTASDSNSQMDLSKFKQRQTFGTLRSVLDIDYKPRTLGFRQRVEVMDSSVNTVFKELRIYKTDVTRYHL